MQLVCDNAESIIVLS